MEPANRAANPHGRPLGLPFPSAIVRPLTDPFFPLQPGRRSLRTIAPISRRESEACARIFANRRIRSPSALSRLSGTKEPGLPPPSTAASSAHPHPPLFIYSLYHVRGPFRTRGPLRMYGRSYDWSKRNQNCSVTFRIQRTEKTTI